MDPESSGDEVSAMSWLALPEDAEAEAHPIVNYFYQKHP